MNSRMMVAALAACALACGDPDTTDRRGYTKAPLETPGLLIKGEDVSPMAALGRPNLPRADLPRDDTRDADGDPAGTAAEVDLAPGVTQEQFEAGRDLYAGRAACQACHGPNGTGSALGPDLTDGQWLHIAGSGLDELAEVIRTGVQQPQEHPGPMPPMGGASLTDEELQALAAYVASISQG